MLERIRKSKFTKVFVCILSLSFVSEAFHLNQALALTGGPSQPEVQGFSPIGATDMVDPFSGDFKYNIPLFDLGGYPVNLVYNSGITGDQEASWVGLGWTLNPGVINRDPRGLPDDFDGDEISKEFYKKPNRNFLLTLSGKYDFTGVPAGEKSKAKLAKLLGACPPASFGVSYNNYTGIGYTFGVSLASQIATFNNKDKTKTYKIDGGIKISGSSTEGGSITPSLGFSQATGDGNDYVKNSINVGFPFNSVSGLQGINAGYSYNKSVETWNIKTRESVISNYNASYGSTLSFAKSTYTPNFGMSSYSGSFTFSAAGGFSVLFGNAQASVLSTLTWNSLAENSLTMPAYGYMYSHNVHDNGAIKNNGHVILDFNREKDGAYFENVPYLPQTNFTYDLFSVAAQGLGGTYRAFRSDLGTVYDSKTNMGGEHFGDLDLSVEGGFTSGWEVGGNGAYHHSWGHSGHWESDLVEKTLLFRPSVPDDPYYEPFYMKNIGETNTESDEKFINTVLGGEDILRPERDGFKGVKSSPFTSSNYRTQRAKRNEPMHLLTADKADVMGVGSGVMPNDSRIFYYELGANDKESLVPLNRNDGVTRRAHHLSELSVYQSNGSRYVYGLPVYNLKKEEVDFALPTGRTGDLSTGLVEYTPDGDDKIENGNGVDEHFNKVVTPPYAYSYLLTNVLSPDYLDIDNISGPSGYDLGSYTNFRYGKVSGNYNWRLPVESEKANYNDGIHSMPNDNRASYVYGEKEIWYLKEIESKTQIAVFTLADRDDALPVNGKSGGINYSGVKQKCLTEINIYSIVDWKNNKENAVPIKTVHFNYDYTLCSQTPNSKSSGKLTLKSVYFTYGKSKKGKYSAYNFKYGELRDKNGQNIKSAGKDVVINPSYNLKANDRWGNYLPNPDSRTNSVTYKTTTSEFPYTPQGPVIAGSDEFEGYKVFDPTSPRTWADIYAHAWNLTSISMPSGGEIKINYEADDYAYVQNKRAMCMFNVVDATEERADTYTPPTFFPKEISFGHDDHVLVVDLGRECASEEELKQLYFNDPQDGSLVNNPNKPMYFRFMMNMADSDEPFSRQCWEFVPGYSTIKNVQLCANNKRYALITLDKQNEKNSISVAGWNFLKVNMSSLALGNKNPYEGSTEQGFSALASAFTSIYDIFRGYYNAQKSKGRCKYSIQGKSWVRLYEPSSSKKGGGHRVRSVAISDQWKTMLGDNNTVDNQDYGQEYVYKTNESGVEISSGVASYEPFLGGDENPFRMPISYKKENFLVPDSRFYMETPICESFFPGASVGYSKVSVMSLNKSGVTEHGTGKVVNEFYTAKDYPTLVEASPMSTSNSSEWGADILKALKVVTFDDCSTTQGFKITLNDMHGKEKLKSVYEVGKTNALSQMEYRYKTNGFSLDNAVLTIRPNGSIENKIVGVNYDMIVDTRNSESYTSGGGIQVNVTNGVVALPWLTIPLGLAQGSYAEQIYRSATSTKVINKHGLLDEIIATQDNSQVVTKNLLYDSESGNVILNSVTNSYTDNLSNPKDMLYSFTYPAHWAYDMMGPIYKTLGAKVRNYSSDLRAGDEVIINDATKAWVVKNADGSNGFIDKNGQALVPSSEVYILRPARRNQQTEPIGTVVTRVNPIEGNQLKFKDILNSSAIQYTDTAKIFCECNVDLNAPYNPFVKGTQGIWKPYTSYSYLTDRVQTNTNNNTNIRTDGNYKDFSAFWQYDTKSQKWLPNYNNWTFTSRVSLYNPYGGELENVDALGNYSSAIFGYNYMLPIAVAKNARYKEIGFDGAEDYFYDGCFDGHLGFKKVLVDGGLAFRFGRVRFKNDKTTVSGTESHTGKQSIEIKANGSVVVKKDIVECK